MLRIILDEDGNISASLFHKADAIDLYQLEGSALEAQDQEMAGPQIVVWDLLRQTFCFYCKHQRNGSEKIGFGRGFHFVEESWSHCSKPTAFLRTNCNTAYADVFTSKAAFYVEIPLTNGQTPNMR